jgi:hypothetical protein
MSSEIIQSVAYDDHYDDFQHVNFIFAQKFVSLFWGLFNDETNLRVGYCFQDPKEREREREREEQKHHC